MRERSTRCRSQLREGADVVLDGGTLPGTPSTVVDLRDYEASGSWHVLREGRCGRGRARAAARAPLTAGPALLLAS